MPTDRLDNAHGRTPNSGLICAAAAVITSSSLENVVGDG
jgi:hypothetical protein